MLLLLISRDDELPVSHPPPAIQTVSKVAGPPVEKPLIPAPVEPEWTTPVGGEFFKPGTRELELTTERDAIEAQTSTVLAMRQSEELFAGEWRVSRVRTDQGIEAVFLTFWTSLALERGAFTPAMIPQSTKLAFRDKGQKVEIVSERASTRLERSSRLVTSISWKLTPDELLAFVGAEGFRISMPERSMDGKLPERLVSAVRWFTWNYVQFGAATMRERYAFATPPASPIGKE